MAQKIERQELIEELQRVADQLGETPASTDMKEHSKYSKQPFQTEFGKWNDALRAADLEVNSTHNADYPINECEWCGDDYKVKPSVEDRSRYCSTVCLNEAKTEWTGEDNPRPNAGERVEKQCNECGDTFYVWPSRSDKAEYCSKECLGEFNSRNLSGEGSPFYKGGHAEYYGPNWRRQRRKRLKIDNYECQHCGITQEESMEKWEKGLEIHHKKRFLDCESYEEANKIDNLITLCVSCHAKIG